MSTEAAASPFSFGVELDLTDAFNRVVDTAIDVFQGTSQIAQSSYACAYPGSFTDAEVREIAEYTQARDETLRWQMKMDSWAPGDEATYELKVQWEGRYFDLSDTNYVFIENAFAWVDWRETGYGWNLYVDVTYSQPNFADGVANMIVDFHIREAEGDGDIVRDTHRRFRIYGDGHRDVL